MSHRGIGFEPGELDARLAWFAREIEVVESALDSALNIAGMPESIDRTFRIAMGCWALTFDALHGVCALPWREADDLKVSVTPDHLAPFVGRPMQPWNWPILNGLPSRYDRETCSIAVDRATAVLDAWNARNREAAL